MPLYCPNCKGMLNQKMNPHCPNCGAEVRNVEKPAKSMAEQVDKAYLIQAGRGAVDQKRQENAGPADVDESEWTIGMLDDLQQRLAAAELAIKGLQEQKAEITAEPEPAAEEFMPEQMADAVCKALFWSIHKLTDSEILALRAARNHILAGKAAG